MMNNNFFVQIAEEGPATALSDYKMNNNDFAYDGSSRRGLKLDTVSTPNDMLYSRPTEVLNRPPLGEEEPNRLYEFWPGKNRFLFKGLLMTGPWEDCGPCTYNWGCLLGISIVYAVLVIPRLVSGILVIIPLININFFMLTIFFLLLTSFTDPGIIPRKDIFELDGPVPFPFSYSPTVQPSDDEANGLVSEAAMMKMQAEKQEFEKVFTLCYTCHIYRPPRAAHCS